MLTVLHRVPVWLPQTETWNHTQISNLPPGRVSCHVVCDTTANLDQFPIPNLHCLTDDSAAARLLRRVARKTPLYPWLRNRYGAAVARAAGARVLHSHFGFYGWQDLPLARTAALRHVVTFYGVDVNKFPRQYPVWRRRYRELFARVDRVLCEGRHMASALVALGCPADKVRVQHLGVRLDQVPHSPLAWRPGEPLKVLIAASFTEKKGIPHAIRALGRIRNDVPLEVTVIGDAADNPDSRAEKQVILRAIAEAGIAPRLLGFQPHRVMLEEGRRHHVFLSPSIEAKSGDTEGGAPVSLIEMAATGMMIVSTRHCDIPDVVRDGETGLLADEGDVDGLTAHLRALIAHPERWEAMRRAGRAHMEADYDAAVQGARLAAIYAELA